MNERRTFLRKSVLLAGAMILGGATRAFASSGMFPAGLIYTEKNTGKWAGKEGSHVPRVTVEGSRVTIVTPHPMSTPHYIVRHTLVATDGTVLGEKTFTPTDNKAVSTYDLPAGRSGALYATSFCNLHDFWVTRFNL